MRKALAASSGDMSGDDGEEEVDNKVDTVDVSDMSRFIDSDSELTTLEDDETEGTVDEDKEVVLR